jgi:hypothetical protein
MIQSLNLQATYQVFNRLVSGYQIDKRERTFPSLPKVDWTALLYIFIVFMDTWLIHLSDSSNWTLELGNFVVCKSQ